MPAPTNYHGLPPVDPASKGNFNLGGEEDIYHAAELIRPRKAGLEQKVATMSRVAVRLFDRLTGKAMGLDEITPAYIGAETPAEAQAKVDTLASAVPNLINWQPNALAKVASAVPLRVGIVGDSLSIGLTPPLNAAVTGVIGMGRVAGATGVTDNAADNNWIAPYHTLAIGATIVYHSDTNGAATAVPIAADRLLITYIAESGAGTFDLQTSSNGGTTWTTAATINAANASTIGVATVYNLSTSNSPRYIARITNVTGGPVKIIGGPGLYNSVGFGVTRIKNMLNTSGLDLVNFGNVPDAIFTPIWTALAPDLIVSNFADAPEEWQDTKLALTNVVTNGTTTITFAAYPTREYAGGNAARPIPQVGNIITGTNIPAGTRIASHTANSTTATLSQAATGSGTNAATIVGAWVNFYSRCKAAFANTDFVQLSMNPTSAPGLSDLPRWIDGTSYSVGDRVTMYAANGTLGGGTNGVFVATTNHTASSTTKPTTGASWASNWTLDIVDPTAAAAGAVSALAQATAQRAWAERAGESFINGFAPFRGYVEGYNKGLLEGDFIHPTPLGHSFKNLTLWSVLPVSNLFLGGFGSGSYHPINMPFASNDSTGQAVIEMSRGVLFGGAFPAATFADTNAPTIGGNNVTISNTDKVLNIGTSARTGQSAWAGWHPQSNGQLLGGRGSLFWRGLFGGLRLGHTAISADYTALNTDFTIEVTTGSPTITLPSPATLNSSVNNFNNAQGGAQGGVYCVVNTGAGFATVQSNGVTRGAGATTNGSPNITFGMIGSTPGVGEYVTGTGIPAGTTILSATFTTAVMSANATATNTGLTFTIRRSVVGGENVSVPSGGTRWFQSTGSGWIAISNP